MRKTSLTSLTARKPGDYVSELKVYSHHHCVIRDPGWIKPHWYIIASLLEAKLTSNMMDLRMGKLIDSKLHPLLYPPFHLRGINYIYSCGPA
jgi:hypothetical protein